MKIVKAKCKKFEEVTTDEQYLNLYRRFEPGIYEHYLGPNYGWMEYRFTEFLEKGYQLYMKEHGERNPDNITNA